MLTLYRSCLTQAADGGARDIRGGLSAQGETSSAGEHPVSSAEDSQRPGTRHRRQREDAPDRLGVLHGPAQEDADGPEDRADPCPSSSTVLGGPLACCGRDRCAQFLQRFCNVSRSSLRSTLSLLYRLLTSFCPI